ncbi:GNAT family N-acetyltransferase [Janthinobacterium sp.]|uniref:GNAT family N-acetyltransferase n=1 Tax=Janthinobacterium sp. TaxID=1871054 RepID=UPI0028A0F71B|nr:GNAT family N-acetyltransferase [Janthinobacterium sp.]
MAFVNEQGATAHITLSATGSPALMALLWEVFFRSRQRGVSLERHFPWLASASPSVTFAEARIGGMTVGGLVLRELSCTLEGKTLRVGMIGLVCVAPSYRGQGVANRLIAAAIAHAGEQGLDCLTLWTSKHAVYEKQGFATLDRWMYGWVRDASGASAQAFHPGSELLPDDNLALPPFAQAVYRYTGGAASIVVLADEQGAIVTAYEGEAAAAAHAMVRLLPSCWRLNVLEHDPLVAALAMLGKTVTVAPSQLQMWRALNAALPVTAVAQQLAIAVIDRI